MITNGELNSYVGEKDSVVIERSLTVLGDRTGLTLKVNLSLCARNEKIVAVKNTC